MPKAINDTAVDKHVGKNMFMFVHVLIHGRVALIRNSIALN